MLDFLKELKLPDGKYENMENTMEDTSLQAYISDPVTSLIQILLLQRKKKFQLLVLEDNKLSAETVGRTKINNVIKLTCNSISYKTL